jgi:hypothetical protein
MSDCVSRRNLPPDVVTRQAGNYGVLSRDQEGGIGR